MGTAATRYSGSQSITTDSYSQGFRLRELKNSVRIETYNMQNHPDTIWANAIDFSDNNNNWKAAEYHNSQFDDAALDAHWGLEKTYSYWSTVRGVNSWNGSGAPLLNYVHVNMHAVDPGNDNDQAGWDGEKVLYGDGVTVFYPVTSLDVIAHEIGHAFLQGVSLIRFPNLTQDILSQTWEGTVLNEGMSDIWGACVEKWVAPNKYNWKNGEEIMKNGFSCLRSLSNPTTEGYRPGYTTEGNYPDTYNISPWYSGYNPYIFSHINSTVLSHWFYLLSNGGCSTNGLGHLYRVWGIGIENAAQIAWYTELNYFTAYSQFSDAYNLTIQAATDLSNGNANSIRVMQVKNAWYAVGIGTQPTQMDLT